MIRLFSEPPAPARPTGRCSRTALRRTNSWSPRQNTVIGRKFAPVLNVATRAGAPLTRSHAAMMGAGDQGFRALWLYRQEPKYDRFDASRLASCRPVERPG